MEDGLSFSGGQAQAHSPPAINARSHPVILGWTSHQQLDSITVSGYNCSFTSLSKKWILNYCYPTTTKDIINMAHQHLLL